MRLKKKKKKGLLVSRRNVGASLLDTILIVASLLSPVTSYADRSKAKPGKEVLFVLFKAI